jgi:hypothetical protein
LLTADHAEYADFFSCIWRGSRLHSQRSDPVGRHGISERVGPEIFERWTQSGPNQSLEATGVSARGWPRSLGFARVSARRCLSFHVRPHGTNSIARITNFRCADLCARSDSMPCLACVNVCRSCLLLECLRWCSVVRCRHLGCGRRGQADFQSRRGRRFRCLRGSRCHHRIRYHFVVCLIEHLKPNKPDAANPAIASRFHDGCQWRGVADPER